MPILAGTDGARKMSKSLGNHIGITESPQEIYGKVLSIPDSSIDEYYSLLLGPEAAASAVRPGSPRDDKHALAHGIVAALYSPGEADAAAAHFERTVVRGQEPEEIEEAGVQARDGSVHLPAVIEAEFGLSRSEARRLIDQGAVSLGSQPLSPGEHDVALERADGEVLRVGKRRFRRLRAG